MRIADTERVIKPNPRRSVYSGQERLGDFQLQGSEYVARDRRGVVIGTFRTAVEAANAISDAAEAA